jgi:hypothetical protein
MTHVDDGSRDRIFTFISFFLQLSIRVLKIIY